MFTYKGINARDMHLRVLNDIEFASPRRDVNLIQIPGRHGDLVMDNGRFESVKRAVPCRMEVPSHVNAEEVISQINNWLIDDGRQHELLWENDPEFIYRASIYDDVISQRILPHYGKTIVNFTIHPIKYLRTSLVERQITSGTSMNNPFTAPAKPIIRIVGSGNINLNVGGRQVVLTGIDRGCILDSENQTILTFDGQRTIFDRMRGSFPELKPGNNVVTFSGNNVQVFITPRLGALV